MRWSSHPMWVVSRVPVKWFCHQNIKIELPSQNKADCDVINTVTVEHGKGKKKSEKFRAGTINAISLLTTANGKTVGNESRKAKSFQIKKASPGSSFRLYSVWLYETDVPIHTSMVSLHTIHVHTLYVWKVTRKPHVEFCLETVQLNVLYNARCYPIWDLP